MRVTIDVTLEENDNVNREAVIDQFQQLGLADAINVTTATSDAAAVGGSNTPEAIASLQKLLRSSTSGSDREQSTIEQLPGALNKALESDRKSAASVVFASMMQNCGTPAGDAHRQRILRAMFSMASSAAASPPSSSSAPTQQSHSAALRNELVQRCIDRLTQPAEPTTTTQATTPAAALTIPQAAATVLVDLVQHDMLPVEVALLTAVRIFRATTGAGGSSSSSAGSSSLLLAAHGLRCNTLALLAALVQRVPAQVADFQARSHQQQQTPLDVISPASQQSNGTAASSSSGGASNNNGANAATLAELKGHLASCPHHTDTAYRVEYVQSALGWSPVVRNTVFRRRHKHVPVQQEPTVGTTAGSQSQRKQQQQHRRVLSTSSTESGGRASTATATNSSGAVHHPHGAHVALVACPEAVASSCTNGVVSVWRQVQEPPEEIVLGPDRYAASLDMTDRGRVLGLVALPRPGASGEGCVPQVHLYAYSEASASQQQQQQQQHARGSNDGEPTHQNDDTTSNCSATSSNQLGQRLRSGASLHTQQQQQQQQINNSALRYRPAAAVGRCGVFDCADVLPTALQFLHTTSRLAVAHWRPGAGKAGVAVHDPSQFETPLAAYLPHQDLITALHFGADRDVIVSAARDGTTALFDLRVNQAVANTSRHQAAILCCATDDTLLATGSTDGTICVFDLRQFHGPPLVKMAADSAVVSLTLKSSLCVFGTQTALHYAQLVSSGVAPIQSRIEETEGMQYNALAWEGMHVFGASDEAALDIFGFGETRDGQ